MLEMKPFLNGHESYTPNSMTSQPLATMLSGFEAAVHNTLPTPHIRSPDQQWRRSRMHPLDLPRFLCNFYLNLAVELHLVLIVYNLAHDTLHGNSFFTSHKLANLVAVLVISRQAISSLCPVSSLPVDLEIQQNLNSDRTGPNNLDNYFINPIIK